MVTRPKNENKGVEYNMIKQVNVNSTIHDIGAKYDADGNVITSQYVRNDNVQTVTVKTLTLYPSTGSSVSYNIVCVPD